MLIVPYTSTLDCASAMHGAAKAPATAIVKSFFCMVLLSGLNQASACRSGPPRQPLELRCLRQCAELLLGRPRMRGHNAVEWGAPVAISQQRLLRRSRRFKAKTAPVAPRRGPLHA